METSLLVKEIANAFPTEPKPADEELLYEGAYHGESELEEIKQFFRCRAWNSITPSDIFRFRHALSFFSESALVYYTAAWLTCSLLDEEAVDTAIENVVDVFGEVDPNRWTEKQRLVICEWLNHFNNVDLPSVKRSFEKAAKNFGCSRKTSQC